MDLGEIGLSGWVGPAQDMDKWSVLMNVVMKLLVQ
jgi:hypothetical protein